MGKFSRTIRSACSVALLLWASSSHAAWDGVAGGTACAGDKTASQLTGTYEVGAICTCTDCSATSEACVAGAGGPVPCYHKGSDVWVNMNVGTTPVTPDVFKTIDAPAGTDPVASGATDTLHLTSTGGSCTITGNSGTKSIDFACAGLTDEQVQDIVGGMVDDTESCISVTYDDDNGNLEFAVSVSDTCITSVDWSKLVGAAIVEGPLTLRHCLQISGACFTFNAPQNIGPLLEPTVGCNGGGYQNGKPVDRCAGGPQRVESYECLPGECSTGSCVRVNETCVNYPPISSPPPPSGGYTDEEACTALNSSECATVLTVEDSLDGAIIHLPADACAMPTGMNEIWIDSRDPYPYDTPDCGGNALPRIVVATPDDPVSPRSFFYPGNEEGAPCTTGNPCSLDPSTGVGESHLCLEDGTNCPPGGGTECSTSPCSLNTATSLNGSTICTAGNSGDGNCTDATGGTTEVEDGTTPSSGWNGDGTHAPSENDLYDLIVHGDADMDGFPDVLDTNATGTTPAANDSDTSLCTTAYVQGEINGAGGNGIDCAGGNCQTDSLEQSFIDTASFEPPSCPANGGLGIIDGTYELFVCGDEAFPPTPMRVCLEDGTNCPATATEVEDGTAPASNWNGDATHAPSENDLYDLIVHGDADMDGFPDVLDTNATGTTPAADDNDTSICTTAYVQTELNAAGGRSVTCASGSCDADAELYTRSKSMTIETPTSADDFLFYRVIQAATITSINCLVISGTSAVITLNECDTAGASCAGVDGATTITCATTATADDGSLSNSGIDATDVMRIDVGTVTGGVTQLMVSITYTEND